MAASAGAADSADAIVGVLVGDVAPAVVAIAVPVALPMHRKGIHKTCCLCGADIYHTQGRGGYQDAAQRPCVNPTGSNSASQARTGSARATTNRICSSPQYSANSYVLTSHVAGLLQFG